MDIYLESEREDVGKYRSEAVPRVGDRISLVMDRIHGNEVTVWKVQSILWKANNVLKTEETMMPFASDMHSETVLLYVTPASEETNVYLDRLHALNRDVK